MVNSPPSASLLMRGCIKSGCRLFSYIFPGSFTCLHDTAIKRGATYSFTNFILINIPAEGIALMMEEL